ncbi:MAG: heme biosynthesis protein HemY [Nitratireductor sp.]
MIRILLFLLVVFALGLGFSWLAERPGELVVTFAGYQYEVSLMVAAIIVTALVAAVMILWWLLKAIWTSPQTVARYFRVRRRDRGYQALSTGMIAAGAGDAGLARTKKREAMKLISADQEPLIHLLDAQASLLEGNHEDARRKFEAMLDDPEMRILGLRGLYLEAQRLGDREAAQHYAGRAAEIAPQLGWASNAALEARTAAGDWDGALEILEARRSTKQIEATEAKRKRAVLLTAKAMDVLDRDPLAAKNAALEANRLAPDLVPAAVIAAKALFRQDDLRKGSKVLETAWHKTAHPDIAATYVYARHGDSVMDRLVRAKKLRSQRQNNAESSLAVARAALEAGELDLARETAEEAMRIEPREAVFLLLADIEEALTGDEGRIRQWLARAVRAPRDPAWVADGVVSEHWAPVSPVTGKLDMFEWRPPVEKTSGLLEQERQEEDELRKPLLAAPVAPAPVAEPEKAAAGDGEAIEEAELVAATPASEPPTTTKKADEEAAGSADADPSEEALQPPPPHAAANDDAWPKEPDGTAMPQPDDPGVDPEDRDDDARSKRFKLF